MQAVVYALSFLIQILAYIAAGYHFVVSLFAWFPRKEKELLTDKKHSFALVVAAHDEQCVIGNMVDSLNALNYDKDLYDIYVIADNCTDKTAEIAREKGAIALERFHKTKRGKGYAMDWAFQQIFEGEIYARGHVQMGFFLIWMLQMVLNRNLVKTIHGVMTILGGNK